VGEHAALAFGRRRGTAFCLFPLSPLSANTFYQHSHRKTRQKHAMFCAVFATSSYIFNIPTIEDMDGQALAFAVRFAPIAPRNHTLRQTTTAF
jgi:hypothetical protein